MRYVVHEVMDAQSSYLATVHVLIINAAKKKLRVQGGALLERGNLN